MKLKIEQKKAFGEKFVERYLAHGFGSMTKAEVDILVFHLLSDSEKIKDKSNYHVANLLQIAESKVKSLRLSAALKYEQANHKEVLLKIVSRITSEMENPEFVSGQIRITIENPVEKRELEHAIKSVGRNIEHGLNKEILHISPIALFELVVSNLENPEKEFENIIQAQIKDKDKQNKIINNALTFRQKLNKVGEEISDKSGLIGLLGAAGGALV